MKRKREKNYSTGEFARYFGIPKDTLLYYDRIGLFSPEFIAPNGYRQYSASQIATFSILLSLREMDVSIQEIRQYLSEKSPERSFVSWIWEFKSWRRFARDSAEPRGPFRKRKMLRWNRSSFGSFQKPAWFFMPAPLSSRIWMRIRKPGGMPAAILLGKPVFPALPMWVLTLVKTISKAASSTRWIACSCGRTASQTVHDPQAPMPFSITKAPMTRCTLLIRICCRRSGTASTV